MLIRDVFGRFNTYGLPHCNNIESFIYIECRMMSPVYLIRFLIYAQSFVAPEFHKSF